MSLVKEALPANQFLRITTRAANKTMKIGNRKVLMALLGVVLAAPFLLIGSFVGTYAVTLANDVRPDVFCLLIVLASVAVRVTDGRFNLASNRQGQGDVEPEVNNDLRRASITAGY